MDHENYIFKRLDDTNLIDLVYLMKSAHVTSSSSSLRYYQKKFNSRFIGLKNFKRQISFLKNHTNIISVQDFFNKKFDPTKNNIAITFDDGFLNNYKYVVQYFLIKQNKSHNQIDVPELIVYKYQLAADGSRFQENINDQRIIDSTRLYLSTSCSNQMFNLIKKIMDEEYVFERLSENNIEDLKILYKDAFNEDRSLEFTRQKFNTKQLGAENIAFIAYDQYRFPAAFFALFPVQILINGKTYLGGQIADLMTHSKHRRKGLFNKLANQTFSFAKEKGMKYIYTSPYGINNPTHDGMLKLNFTDMNIFKGYHVKVNTLPLNRFSQKIKLLNLLYQPYYKLIQFLFIKQADFFKNYTVDLGYGEVLKNNDYLTYKFGYSSAKIFKINNVLFLCKLKPDGSLAIGDVDKNNVNEIKKAIKKLKRIAFWLGIRIIQFETSKGHIIDQVLIDDYQPVNKFRFLYYNLDEKFPGEKIRHTLADIDTF